VPDKRTTKRTDDDVADLLPRFLLVALLLSGRKTLHPELYEKKPAVVARARRK